MLRLKRIQVRSHNIFQINIALKFCGLSAFAKVKSGQKIKNILDLWCNVSVYVTIKSIFQYSRDSRLVYPIESHY